MFRKHQSLVVLPFIPLPRHSHQVIHLFLQKLSIHWILHLKIYLFRYLSLMMLILYLSLMIMTYLAPISKKWWNTMHCLIWSSAHCRFVKLKSVIEVSQRIIHGNNNRLYRITTSNFYSAAVNTVEPSLSFSSTATQHGKLYESHVRSFYLNSMIKKGYHNISVDKPGLIISKSYSFLGASLDGIVHDNDISWGLQIKCAFQSFQLLLRLHLMTRASFLQEQMRNSILKRKSLPLSNSRPNVLFWFVESGSGGVVWRSWATIHRID